MQARQRRAFCLRSPSLLTQSPPGASLSLVSTPLHYRTPYVASCWRNASTTGTDLSSIGNCFAKLTARRVLSLTGPDTVKWLNGLTTNDLHPLDNIESDPKAIYTAILAPQGRLLADVLISASKRGSDGQLTYFLECDSTISAELQKHLKRFKLREKVNLVDSSDRFNVWTVLLANAEPTTLDMYKKKLNAEGACAFVDPRLPAMGLRVIMPQEITSLKQLGEGLSEVDVAVYHLHRILNGVCEGSEELPYNSALPLECNLDLLNGVSFTKGCYVGQELTSRVHHTGVIRKRLLPLVAFAEEDLPQSQRIIADIAHHYTTSTTPRNHLLPRELLLCKSFQNTRLMAGSSLATTAGESEASKKAGKVLSGGVYNVGMGMVRMDDLNSVLQAQQEGKSEQQERQSARVVWPLAWARPLLNE